MKRVSQIREIFEKYLYFLLPVYELGFLSYSQERPAYFGFGEAPAHNGQRTARFKHELCELCKDSPRTSCIKYVESTR